MLDNNLYISVDIESDGPTLFKNSMIALGAAAFTLETGVFDQFYCCLKELPNCQPDPQTMKEFWDKHLKLYNSIQKSAVDPTKVMHRFVEWAEDLGTFRNKKPIFIAYPAGYDFTWVYTYMMYFVGRSPFGFVALDFKSYAAGKLGMSYRNVSKRTMPKSWFPARKHTHIAVEDAIEQAEIFIAAMKS